MSGVGALAVAAAAVLGMRVCIAEDFKAPGLDELKPMLRIEWRLGPDYPMGIQDSAVGSVGGKIVSAGGFTRYPLDICKQYPDAFGGQASGFTNLAFVFDPKNESAGWTRIADLPGPARQGAAVAVVDNELYAMGGINYTPPFTYRDTYRLQEKKGQWVWEELQSCQLPWPVYGNAGSTAVIGKNIYLLGAADFFQGPGADGNDFHSEKGRTGIPVGNALLVLDTTDIEAGWKRLSDCPGVDHNEPRACFRPKQGWMFAEVEIDQLALLPHGRCSKRRNAGFVVLSHLYLPDDIVTRQQSPKDSVEPRHSSVEEQIVVAHPSTLPA